MTEINPKLKVRKGRAKKIRENLNPNSERCKVDGHCASVRSILLS